MQCNDCKWFVGNVNDHYGICKRYPTNQNKTKSDFCGEFLDKSVPKISIQFNEPTEFEAPKRGRKPKE